MIARVVRFIYGFPPQAFLALCVLGAIVPFLDFRVLRMAGDEKVYVAQAIEMARDGRWFVQTLAGEPNYFKGPLHYILVRAGLLVFGDRLVAGLWMNALFALVAALALYRLGRRRLPEDRALLLGLMGGLNVGVFSHALASQMEVELFAFYALAALALGRREESREASGGPAGFLARWKHDIPFWLVAGAAGWIKSPAHSVLIGVGGIAYWIACGTALRRLRSPGSWLAALTGVAACVAGYLPAALFDFENFYHAFFLRENLTKGGNNRAWHYVVLPLLHFSAPWTLLLLFGAARAWKTPRGQRPLAVLGLSLGLPTVLLWASWPYKGQNYNLPALGALFIFALACFDRELPRAAFRALGALALVCVAALAAIVFHFIPLPEWWKWSWVLFGFAAILVFAAAFLFSLDARVLGLGAAALFLGFGALVTPLGERELRDLRAFAREHPGIVLHYDDLEPSIWSEWGLLQLALRRPVQGVHKPEQLSEALRPGHALLLAGDAALERAKMAFAATHSAAAENAQPSVTEWNRWLTKGKSAEGRSMWLEAWRARDLRKLERRHYILWSPAL